MFKLWSTLKNKYVAPLRGGDFFRQYKNLNECFNFLTFDNMLIFR